VIARLEPIAKLAGVVDRLTLCRTPPRVVNLDAAAHG
jgi:hypothetical protein